MHAVFCHLTIHPPPLQAVCIVSQGRGGGRYPVDTGGDTTSPPAAGHNVTLPPAAAGGNVTLCPDWLFFSVYRSIMGKYLDVLKKSLVW